MHLIRPWCRDDGVEVVWRQWCGGGGHCVKVKGVGNPLCGCDNSGCGQVENTKTVGGGGMYENLTTHEYNDSGNWTRDK